MDDRTFNQPNPMLLPNIVSNILHHISDTEILAKLRTVCRCWNHEACFALRQLQTIELTDMKSLQSYTTIFQSTYEMFGVFPHSKYKFALRNDQSQLKPSSTQPELMGLIDKFLDHFGEYITNCHLPVRSRLFEASFIETVVKMLPNIISLGLHIQYYHQQTMPLQLSQNTVHNLQRVRSLTIRIEGFEISEEKITELLSILFLYLPNLQRIIYPGDIRRISKTGLLLRDIILDSDTSNNLSKLCEWDFKTRLLEEHCFKLLDKEFPMKTLYADLYNPEDDEDCVDSNIMACLFQKWSETLNHLEIEFPYRKEVSFHFYFPETMENLTYLYLGGFEGCLFSLLRKLPRLNKLDLGQLALMSILPKPNEQDVYSHVKQLRLDFCMEQSTGVLSRFSRIFPELQILNINHATNEVARVIFQKMNSLTTLTIQGNDLTDAGMCGFSEYATKENNFLSLTPTEGNKFRKYAYIADLKSLHYLNLEAYELTEVTVRHGLVHCQSLRLVKMDCTAGGGDCSTIFRKFKLSDYNNHLVEEGQGTIVEMKEEPPMEGEELEFFESHDKCSDDLVDLLEN